ncbi:hypothetical protein ACJX0J_030698, partial [Zea mays]
SMRHFIQLQQDYKRVKICIRCQSIEQSIIIKPHLEMRENCIFFQWIFYFLSALGMHTT